MGTTRLNEGGDVAAPAADSTWNPTWATPDVSYTAVQPDPSQVVYPQGTPGTSVSIPLGGAANPAIQAYLGGTNPAAVSYDPAIQGRLREHRKALQNTGVKDVGREVAAGRASIAGGGTSAQATDLVPGTTLTRDELSALELMIDPSGSYDATKDVLTPEQREYVSNTPEAQLAQEDIAHSILGSANAPAGPVGDLINNSLVGKIFDHVTGDQIVYDGDGRGSLITGTASEAPVHEDSVLLDDGSYDISDWFTPAPVGNDDNDNDHHSNATQYSFSDPVKDTDSFDFGSAYNYNRGGLVNDEDVWGTDPLASTMVEEGLDSAVQTLASGLKEGLAQSGHGQQGIGQTIKGKLKDQAIGALFGGFGLNEGGMIPQGYNRGGWVGARAQHLNSGGMPMEQAGVQAYQDMLAVGGPQGSPSDMMPDGGPAPKDYNPATFGYKPSGTSTKEQMEIDAMMAKRDAHVGDQMRKDKAFEEAERRKEETHRAAMLFKQEGHQESMKQKRSGPKGE